MATITKRRIELRIIWNKDDPDNLTYLANCQAFIPDDTEDGGEEKLSVNTEVQTITRTAFRALTGLQIQNNIVADVDAALDALGSGAGTHTLVDDTGN